MKLEPVYLSAVIYIWYHILFLHSFAFVINSAFTCVRSAFFFKKKKKNVTWRTAYNLRHTRLFRFVCTEGVSLIWFLQIWVAIYVKGTMVNWSALVKKVMQTYIVIVSGSILNVSTHLTPHMTLSIETCIRRTPCIKRTLQHSPRMSCTSRFISQTLTCWLKLRTVTDWKNTDVESYNLLIDLWCVWMPFDDITDNLSLVESFYVTYISMFRTIF